MKSFFVLALLLSSQVTMAYELFSNPSVKIAGKTYEIAIYDISARKYLDEAYTGFCKRQGYSRGGDATQSYRDGYGPYVILSADGKIVEKLPREGNEGRFRTMFQAYCQ